jgi:hypothetical protein
VIEYSCSVQPWEFLLPNILDRVLGVWVVLAPRLKYERAWEGPNNEMLHLMARQPCPHVANSDGNSLVVKSRHTERQNHMIRMHFSKWTAVASLHKFAVANQPAIQW